MKNNIHKIPIKLQGDRTYEIIISPFILRNAGKYIKNIRFYKKAIIISDTTVSKYYLQELQQSLNENNIEHSSILIPYGEQSKSFTQLERICNKALEFNIDRASVVIALGGGVVGDIAGFSASILLRGIDLIQIPTTLLSQVDSSVGGKTAINNNQGKNLIGTFYQPKLVLIDPNTLNSLESRHIHSGYGEILKYALIHDKNFFSELTTNLGKNILSLHMDSLIYAIKQSCLIKAKIVSLDETEQGVRALLNFGHTFAHVLEKITGYSDKLYHGEAVLIGIQLGAKLSYNLNMLSQEDMRQITSHIKDLNLNINLSAEDISKINCSQLISHMQKDKKALNGAINMILLEKIGIGKIINNVSHQSIIKVWQELGFPLE